LAFSIICYSHSTYKEYHHGCEYGQTLFEISNYIKYLRTAMIKFLKVVEYCTYILDVNYACIVTNMCGSITSNPGTLIVNTSPTSTPTGTPADTTKQKISNIATTEPVTTAKEAAAEASQRVIQTAAVKKEGVIAIYGHSLFTDKSLEVFRTTDGAQAPDTYVLGDGDEIRISIFGASQTDIQQQVALDGSIQPTGVAKIFLKGLSLAQAKEVIQNRLSSAYTFRSDQFAVTIVTARTIMVNVFGEANITGGFTISALNSALNALSAAGGPTDIGSVRSIQLIRGNTRRNIDIYAFMNDPATQFKFDLQNNDIIFVPVVKTLVTIEGAVKRPMTYEMLPNETLTNLIQYAGDVKMDVFPDFVQIERYINGEQRLFEYDLKEVRSGKTKVDLMNGDLVHIKAIGKPMDQYVDVEGSVYYPGRFDLSSNATLKALIANAKPTYQAKTDVLFIERIKPDSTFEVLSVQFPEHSQEPTILPFSPVTGCTSWTSHTTVMWIPLLLQDM